MTRTDMIRELIALAKARNVSGLAATTIIREYIIAVNEPDYETARAKILALPEHQMTAPPVATPEARRPGYKEAKR